MSSVMLSQRRLWAGTIVTSLSIPFVFFLANFLYYSAMGDSWPWNALLGSLGFTYLFGLPSAFMALVFLGWPWLKVLARWKKLSVRYVCAGASVIGAIVFVVTLTVLRGRWPSELNILLEQLGKGFGLGLLSALGFCAAARVPMRPG